MRPRGGAGLPYWLPELWVVADKHARAPLFSGPVYLHDGIRRDSLESDAQRDGFSRPDNEVSAFNGAASLRFGDDLEIPRTAPGDHDDDRLPGRVCLLSTRQD